MKISEQWLREWVEVGAGGVELADRLTMAGLEVDSVSPAAPAFSGVVVAEIRSCARHPDAEKLQVCQVSAGGEDLQIVCGAPNARAGLKVPLATIGASMPGDFKIRRAKLRGVESFGMLCSARELGLSEESDGLLELPADAPVGVDLREYLQLDDCIIEVDLTPNRSDCLGMLGIAREVGVLLRQTVRAPAIEPVKAASDATVDVRVEAPAACPRYLSRVIKSVDAGAATPQWLRERLRRAGLRSLGAVVDVTNYVLLELGQPMHAFDLAKLEGGIVVRMARAGEQLELLNGQTIEPAADSLVIADRQRPLALAGVMGGAGSAVGEQTRDIVLESAFFAPLAVAGRARQYGLHTDSSHRFERGVDPQLQRLAMERATQLILNLAGGEAGPVVEVSDASQLPVAREVHLREARIQHLLGAAIPAAEVEDILRRLGMELCAETDGWLVRVPPYRFDVAIEVDLIEELARIWGYNRLPTRRHAGSLSLPTRSESRLDVRRVRDVLIGRGYQEAITFSFVDPKLQSVLDPEQPALALANPISADLAVMRTTLWPSLLKVVQHNQNRQQSRIRLFETGLRFRGALDTLEQQPVLAGVVMGARLPEQWAARAEGVDFFDVKGDLESLLALTGAANEFSFCAEAHPALHPGQSARIYRGERAVGWVGALHPEVEKTLDLAGRTYVFELGLEALLAAKAPAFKPLSRFPSIRRDLAVVMNDTVTVAAVAKAVAEAGGELLRDTVLFDVYQGKGIEPGSKSLAISLILQDSSRTLTDQDVEEVIARVVERLRQDFGASLRE